MIGPSGNELKSRAGRDTFGPLVRAVIATTRRFHDSNHWMPPRSPVRADRASAPSDRASAPEQLDLAGAPRHALRATGTITRSASSTSRLE